MPEPLKLALEAAKEAGVLLLQQLQSPIAWEEKGRRADLVTEADRMSERAIVGRLRAAYPNATILGEEGGTRGGTSDERWIVDPLDGTTNYAHRYPLFCISIAYERGGETCAGVVYAPMMDECFAAERGAGAQCNGRPIRVSAVADIADAMLCTGFKPSDYERNAQQFAAASRRVQAVRRDGAAALDLAYTAMGRFDGFWEFDLNAWDVAAGALLVREAGGTVTAIDGSAHALRDDVMTGNSILATNGHIHAATIELLTHPPPSS